MRYAILLLALVLGILLLTGCGEQSSSFERNDYYENVDMKCVVFYSENEKHHVLLSLENHPSEYDCSEVKEFIKLDVYPSQIIWRYGYNESMCGSEVGEVIKSVTYPTKELVSDEYKRHYWDECVSVMEETE